MTRFPLSYVPYIVEKMVSLDHGPGPLWGRANVEIFEANKENWQEKTGATRKNVQMVIKKTGAKDISQVFL